MGHTLSVKLLGRPHDYEIVIGNGVLPACGQWAKTWLGDTAKIVVISNPTVYKLYGSVVTESLRNAGFDVSHFLMKDGERFKNLRSAEAAIKFLSHAGLTRTDAVVALGGGVVGDLAGFAAAVYLRGIRYLQLPTTLLSKIDSSVGGKTGVNTQFGKNLVGSFHQPSGVLIDSTTLRTLPPREITAGLCEMVKHAVLSGKTLFKQTDEFLYRYSALDFSHTSDSTFESDISKLILGNIRFKAAIVAGDKLESSARMDARSRKILNFGHTLAHALEKVTAYKHFKHGEAVGYGIMFAAELSKSLALCDRNDVNLLNDVLHRVGPLPPLAGIDPEEVFEAFRFDKKQFSDGLQMVLLKGLGKPIIFPAKNIPPAAMRAALKKLIKDWA